MIIHFRSLLFILTALLIIVGCVAKSPVIYSPLKNNYQNLYGTAELNEERKQPDEYIKENERLYKKLAKQTIVIENTEDENGEEYEEDEEKEKLKESYNETKEVYNDIVWFEIGRQAVIAENWSEALIAFNKAIKLNPQNTEAYFYRGNVYDELGNYKQAIVDYNKTIKLNPVYIDAYLRRGFAYNNLGKLNEAMDNIKMAAKLGDNIAQKFLKEKGIAW